MYVTKLPQGARQLMFGVDVDIGRGVQYCQNGVCNIDFELEKEVKVQRPRNFDWPYLRHG